MTRQHRLKAKITIQGHVIYPSIYVRYITHTPFELDSLHFIQTFLLVRQCTEHMPQPNWLKVTGQGIYP